MGQQTLSHLVVSQKKYGTTHPKQVQVTDCLVSFVAEDLMPLRVVDSSRFKAFVQALDPNFLLPSRKHLSTSLLDKKYTTLKKAVMKRLEAVKDIHLTIDIWSNRQMKSFLGVTGHYISSDWKLESVMLCCNRITGRHTGDNILQSYEELAVEFNIDRKVGHIVTDNASNMMRAFVTLQGFNDIDEREDEVSDSEEGTDSTSDDISAAVVLNETLTPFEHHSCFAHSLQLVIKDGFSGQSQINGIIAKCAKLVSFVRKSTIATDFLEGEKRLQMYTSTRWNSQLKMLRSILSIPQEKLAELNDERAPKLTSYERKMITELLEILVPFEEATDFAQTENIPSSGYVVPCIRGMSHELAKLHRKYNSSFVRNLNSSFERRLLHLQDHQTFRLAAMLDPRFKLRWRTDAEKDDLRRLLRRKVLEMNPVEDVDGVQQVSDSEPEPKRKRVECSQLFQFMSSILNTSETDLEPLEKEIISYLDSACEPISSNPLTFWSNNSEKFKRLCIIAQNVLAIPASSAPVERLFSIAGKVFRPERCGLRDDRFSAMMFIRCNNHLI